jgi:hypothetical protein
LSKEVLLEKLLVAEQLQKFSEFFEAQKFLTDFKISRQWKAADESTRWLPSG